MSGDRQDANDRFRSELDLPFPLVGDPTATIIAEYDVKWPLVKLASRVTYLVGRDRRIAEAHKSARDVRSHVDLVCSWSPE